MAPLKAVEPHSQRGQAMVEFALILPLLILLSFGTLEIGLYLQRRLELGGAAFLAARAAAVQGPQASSVAREVLSTYAQDSGARWMSPAADSAVVQNLSPHLLQVVTTRKGDAWSGLLTGAIALTGSKPVSISQWSETVAIQPEFVPRINAPSSSEGRARTDTMVDYTLEPSPWAGSLSFMGRLSQIPGLGSFGLALDPMAQAVAPNPSSYPSGRDPNATKAYVGIYAEDGSSSNAAKLHNGLTALQGVVDTFAAGQAIDPALKAAL
ncbi:MAG: pilus assembly protein, partial [Cyanobacteria bacterium REEB65]|nr:pilus assembly protein [Cyanobacteria bacterium REEB65]